MWEIHIHAAQMLSSASATIWMRTRFMHLGEEEKTAVRDILSDYENTANTHSCIRQRWKNKVRSLVSTVHGRYTLLPLTLLFGATTGISFTNITKEVMRVTYRLITKRTDIHDILRRQIWRYSWFSVMSQSYMPSAVSQGWVSAIDTWDGGERGR